MKKIIVLLLSVFLFWATSCGGGGSAVGDANPSIQPCELYSSVTGKFGEVDLSEIDLGYCSILYNESREEVFLDDVYEYLGLDKNDNDDVQLLAYIFGAANYRLIIGQIIGERTSLLWGIGDQLREELNIFIYDLDDYAIGDPIEIEDTSAIEQMFRDEDYEGAISALINLFRTFRDDGKINAVAGFNPDRSQDVWWLQDFINVFSPRTVQASGGCIKITSVVDPGDTVNNGTLTQPYENISKVSGEFQIDFQGTGAEGSYCLSTRTSTEQD